MNDALAFSPKAIRDLLLAQAITPTMIGASRQIGLNFPIFLLDEISRTFAVSPDFNDPIIELLLSKQTGLGFMSDWEWLDQAVRLSAWASLDQVKKLVVPCIARGPVLGAIWLLKRTESPVDKEHMLLLASRVETEQEKDELCAFVYTKRPDLFQEITLKCENSLLANDDIPF